MVLLDCIDGGIEFDLTPARLSARRSIGKPTGMVLEVDDIEATFSELKARGVPIEEEPSRQPWGWWGVFADQDGNTYGVHQ